MKTIVLLAFHLACALAVPAPYVSTVPFVTRTPEIQYTSANVGILNQINQMNDDGSYTFGYESGDGSFRIETRDIDGLVTGKYGYIDVNGEAQEFEYVAGSVAGQPLGYQARGTAIPVVDRTQRFPIMPAAVPVEQKVVDYAYSSVDDDRDGFPDRLTTGILGDRNKGQVVRVTSQAQTSFQNPSNILSVINPAAVPAAISQPSIVRLPSSAQNPASVLGVINPAAVSAAISQPSVVRLTSPSRKPSRVRVVNPISNQQQVPIRQVGGFQMIKQSRRKPQRIVQVGQSVRSPFYTSNNQFLGQQQFVTRSPALSSGTRFDQFLGGLNTVRDRYGRLVVRANAPTSYAPAFQTVVVNDDLEDVFDDLDDDDTFIVNSATFGR